MSYGCEYLAHHELESTIIIIIVVIIVMIADTTGGILLWSSKRKIGSTGWGSTSPSM